MDINVNYLADALNKKIDLPDGKGQDGIDYVVEWKRPTAEDPNWYRVYKSGWIEQGGIVTSISNNGNKTITLPKQMSDINYTITTSQLGALTNFYNRQICIEYNTITTTSFVISNRRFIGESTNTIDARWQVSGQGA